MVGKKTDQVRRDKSGSLISDDKETFDKLNQAVNSCKDLVHQLVRSSGQDFFGAVVPVLVVPSNTLWEVKYAADGELVERPHTVAHATLLLNHPWVVDRGGYGPISYCLSHLELITIDTLSATVKGWLGPYGFFAGFQS
jgi:hypothetical protein